MWVLKSREVQRGKGQLIREEMAGLGLEMYSEGLLGAAVWSAAQDRGWAERCEQPCGLLEAGGARPHRRGKPWGAEQRPEWSS